jgi:sterol desaturase/sphingolipid hydroxylase (fatty acid hydroxylase superfamily)
MVLGGFEPEQAYIVHFIAIIIGHLNHANIRITWGPFKYILNNSVMHLYHHMKVLPENKPKGINFGISLSIWDFLFKTSYVPDDNGEIELGFLNEENFPKGFFSQLFTGFGKN